MTDAERRLKEAQVLWPKADTAHQDSRSFFSQARPWGGIEDDHLPFLHAGVPILHAIPSPFPSVWHKLSDDATALDYATMHAWCMILRLTIAEYLELDIGGMRGAIPSVNEPQESPTGESEPHTLPQERARRKRSPRVELVSLARPAFR